MNIFEQFDTSSTQRLNVPKLYRHTNICMLREKSTGSRSIPVPPIVGYNPLIPATSLAFEAAIMPGSSVIMDSHLLNDVLEVTDVPIGNIKFSLC